jgi:hypothetical protein
LKSVVGVETPNSLDLYTKQECPHTKSKIQSNSGLYILTINLIVRGQNEAKNRKGDKNKTKLIFFSVYMLYVGPSLRLNNAIIHPV